MQNVEMTPARRELAERIAEREAASAELANLTARVQRLARAREAIQPLESELVALGIAESAAALAWSESDDGSPASVADAKRRAKIEAALLSARASARAADGATAGLTPQVERVGANIRALTSRIQQDAAAVVVQEAADGLFPELKAAIAAVEVLYGRVRAARRFAIIVTEPAPGQAIGPNLIDFTKFDRDFDLASARPERVEDTAEWFGLAQALQADATATLEVQS